MNMKKLPCVPTISMCRWVNPVAMLKAILMANFESTKFADK